MDPPGSHPTLRDSIAHPPPRCCSRPQDTLPQTTTRSMSVTGSHGPLRDHNAQRDGLLAPCSSRTRATTEYSDVQVSAIALLPGPRKSYHHQGNSGMQQDWDCDFQQFATVHLKRSVRRRFFGKKVVGRKEGRKLINRGGPNEERTGTVPTYISRMYALANDSSSRDGMG
ncbi:hypothetical protein C8R43DRAFT_1007808 [Mycena crocata]|nr:hypothetical protein C8R43DRAFT_1007808 [Mycena crocata]